MAWWLRTGCPRQFVGTPPRWREPPDGAETIGRMIDLATLAVERNRPADADKAAKFARIVIDEYLADF